MEPSPSLDPKSPAHKPLPGAYEEMAGGPDLGKAEEELAQAQAAEAAAKEKERAAKEKAAKEKAAKEKEKAKKSKDHASHEATKALPRDFALRLATRVTAINEREMDESLATSKVAALLFRNLSDPDMHDYFLDMVQILLENSETQKYAATSWVSLLWHEDENPGYRPMVESMLKGLVDGHRAASREAHIDKDSGKYFSYSAFSMGEVFIQLIRYNSDLYEMLTDMFSFIIRMEMAYDLNKKEADRKKRSGGRKKKEEETIKNTKKLYDDIIDYITQRGDFRSDTLNQKNPNEFIAVLADRMRSTRRYVIQDIMNRHALEKKKQLEKELREREAGAEEVISAASPFNHGLYLYWVEKRYNFKYLAVEKVRITLQVMGLIMGIAASGLGYLQLAPISLMEGLMVAFVMFIGSKLVCSRYLFLGFYPKDVTAELEQDVSIFTPTFRKMSFAQLNSFMNKQIRHRDNNLLLHLLPEYVKYIFAVMPDRNNVLITKEELSEFMDRLEVNISKFQRTGN